MSDAPKLTLAPVAILPVITTLDVPTQRILQGALDSEMKAAVVIGYDKDGEFYFASSQADGADVLWLLELAKKKLFGAAS